MRGVVDTHWCIHTRPHRLNEVRSREVNGKFTVL